MAFFEEHKKQIIIITSILLIITSLFTVGKKTNATFIDEAVGFVIVPLQKLTTSIGSWVGDKTSSYSNKVNLEEENKRLQLEISILQSENKRLALYDEENKTLSELLKISQKYPNYETFAARIISKNPGNWYNIFVINKGKSDSLAPEMVLTASGGLVGKLIECGRGYSKAQSILDSRSSVSAMSLRTGDLGVVKGDYTLMNDGLCRMEYIDAESEIMEGDEIVTSSLSNIYPPGITIGNVKEIKIDTNGLTKYAIIEPQVDFKHLDTVLVIGELFSEDFSEETN